MEITKEAKLCSEGFEQACRKTGARDMILHSDRGSQYTSNDLEVRSVIYRYIAYYNLRRIYSTNGGYPPMAYRRMYYSGQLVA